MENRCTDDWRSRCRSLRPLVIQTLLLRRSKMKPPAGTIYYDMDGKRLDNVAGPFHFWPSPHNMLTRIGPTGVKAQGWQCQACGSIYVGLHEFDTFNCRPHEPCPSCGLRGICATDCRGVMDALGDPSVYIAGQVDPDTKPN